MRTVSPAPPPMNSVLESTLLDDWVRVGAEVPRMAVVPPSPSPSPSPLTATCWLFAPCWLDWQKHWVGDGAISVVSPAPPPIS